MAENHWEDDRKAFGDVNDSDIESQDMGQGVMTGDHLDDDEDEFKPTQNEILEYAQFLGMDIVQDADLLYIAEEGLKAPVPDPWKIEQDENEEIFYRNENTGEVMQDHPMDAVYREKFHRAKQSKMGGQGFGQISPKAIDPVTGLNTKMAMPGTFEAKLQDPLIRAQTEKKVAEARESLDKEFNQQKEQLDQMFEKQKKDLLNQNKRDIEREKTKWETFKRAEEKRIREEAESTADSKLHAFKQQLKLEEDQEMARIQQDTDQKLRDYEREFEEKLEHEKKELGSRYERSRRRVEAHQQELFDIEMDKFRKHQNKNLESKRSDIDKLTSEKRKIQVEFSNQLDQIRKETERKFERENRELQEQMGREIAALQKEEDRKYEQMLDQMKREAQRDSGRHGEKVQMEINEYKQQLQDETNRSLKEHEREQQDIIRKEEDRLEKERENELKEYEQVLKEQFEAEFKRKEQKLLMYREKEEHDLELSKLRIDKEHQDKIDGHRRQCQQKFDREKRVFEEEKQRRLKEIQQSIAKLNIDSADKEKLSKEVSTLNKEQRSLQDKVDEFERELENEKVKKRQIEREIQEVNIKMSQKMIENSKNAAQDSSRAQWLREEIAKKQVAISSAQREYKILLEQRQEEGYQHQTVGFGQSASYSPPPKGADMGSKNIEKLEAEMSEIKAMLNQYGLQGNNRTGMNVSEMLNNLDAVDDSVSNISMGFNARGSDLGESWGQNEDEGQLRDFIKRQKMQIKKMQDDLANKKKQYQADKASNENIRLSDPELYRMKHQVLNKVKETIDERISKINARVQKVKAIEDKLAYK